MDLGLLSKAIKVTIEMNGQNVKGCSEDDITDSERQCENLLISSPSRPKKNKNSALMNHFIYRIWENLPRI